MCISFFVGISILARSSWLPVGRQTVGIGYLFFFKNLLFAHARSSKSFMSILIWSSTSLLNAYSSSWGDDLKRSLVIHLFHFTPFCMILEFSFRSYIKNLKLSKWNTKFFLLLFFLAFSHVLFSALHFRCTIFIHRAILFVFELSAVVQARFPWFSYCNIKLFAHTTFLAIHLYRSCVVPCRRL